MHTLSHQCTIKRTRLASALRVSERGDPRVQSETLSEDVFDVIGADRLQIGIVGAFGHDDDRFALSDFAVLREDEM